MAPLTPVDVARLEDVTEAYLDDASPFELAAFQTACWQRQRDDGTTGTLPRGDCHA